MKRLFFPFALLLLLTACEKDIDLKLNTSPAQLTIEGNLADDGQPGIVQLSRSTTYDAANSFPAVRGATVTLRDETSGQTETLAETSVGHYQGSRLTGQVGHRYALSVSVDGQTYTATSTLPAPVPLTGLRLESTSFGPNTRLNVVPEYADPAGTRNYYYFGQEVNGRRLTTLYLQDDELTDGNANRQPLRGSLDDDELKTGDQVRVELRNVDAATYEYLRTLNQLLQSNPLFATSPANPTSNISGGALGYFSAHAVQHRSIVVP